MKLDCIFALGDGSKISFWKDTWCGESPFYESFLALYSLAIARWAKVADICDSSRGKELGIPPLSDLSMTGKSKKSKILCLVNIRRVK